MTAAFIVRAGVDPDARDAFDRWYETGHLPDAVAALGAAGAPRAAGAARTPRRRRLCAKPLR